ncbi:hypothetical protein [Consotaella aegiceratis]|uniref:hypothetical protein n=1 Tax=Consotaella aegiceratis TaxID=3097961 RepID=UPI002F40A2DC
MAAHRLFRVLMQTALVAGALGAASSAFALSQIGTDGEEPAKEGIIAVPLPPLDLDETAPTDTDDNDDVSEPEEIVPATGTDQPDVDEGEPAPDQATATTDTPTDVLYGDEDLPRPVRDLRQRLMDIARTGEVEKLRPYLETGPEGTVLSFGTQTEDPIAFLKELSGDGEGAEILAILLEVLEAGHVHNEPGTDNEIYVWPYFTQMSLDTLTKRQMVELFELVTAGDFEAMKGFGAYNFYRVGITPDGRWQFFVAGD